MLRNARMLDTDSFLKDVAGVTPWVTLEGFDISRLWPDFLHIVDLAIAPEASASAAPAATVHGHGIRCRGSCLRLFDEMFRSEALLELTSGQAPFEGGACITITMPACLNNFALHYQVARRNKD